MKKIFTNAEINGAARKDLALFISPEVYFPETPYCTEAARKKISITQDSS